MNQFPILALTLASLLCPNAQAAASPAVPRATRQPGPPLRTGADLPVPAATDWLGVSREIWISVRPDNQPGDGTLGNPFNGSGGGFDARMRDLCVTNRATHINIHLLPGTYETRGDPAWCARTGWKIHGAGIDLTSVKLTGVTGYVATVISSAYDMTDIGDVEVSNLTVDCNHNPGNSNVANAVVLWGGGNVIRRVKAINANGVFPIYETFVLFIGLGAGTRNEGNVIEDCEVSNFKGTYGTAIGLGGSPEPFYNRYIQGTLRRNRVTDLQNSASRSAFNSYGMGGVRDGIVEDNVAVRCSQGFYTDTGKDVNLTIRGNQFLGCRDAGISLAGRAVDAVIIENNFIEMDPTSRRYAIGCSDNDGTAPVVNLEIRHNIIRSMNGRFGSAGGIGLFLTPEHAQTCLVMGNRVDAALRSMFAVGNVNSFFDNTDFEGKPIVLVEGSGGNHVNLPVGETGSLLLNKGNAYVIAEVGGDPAANGTNLVQAYARAKAMTPHGQPLSSTNRAVVFLLPGRYLLRDSALVLDTAFVDLIGLGDAQTTRLESEGNVVVQPANDVCVENLTLHCTSSAPPTFGSQHKAAYAPSDNLTRTVIRNCTFSAAQNGWSMRLGITYAGQYQGCISGPRGWGGPGNFSGRAENCRAGDYSFGSGGVFTGGATNCTAGAASFGGGGTGGFHGFAKGCSTGHDSFGGSGTLIACEVNGAVNSSVLTTGKLTDCRIGPAPGNVPAIVVGGGAVLYNCTVLADPAGNAYSIDAPATTSARVAHCRLNHGMRNVVNAIAQSFNVEDANVE